MHVEEQVAIALMVARHVVKGVELSHSSGVGYLALLARRCVDAVTEYHDERTRSRFASVQAASMVGIAVDLDRFRLRIIEIVLVGLGAEDEPAMPAVVLVHQNAFESHPVDFARVVGESSQFVDREGNIATSDLGDVAE